MKPIVVIAGVLPLVAACSSSSSKPMFDSSAAAGTSSGGSVGSAGQASGGIGGTTAGAAGAVSGGAGGTDSGGAAGTSSGGAGGAAGSAMSCVPGPTKGGCSKTTPAPTCDSYSGAAFGGVPPGACPSPGMVVTDCPAADRVGRCVISCGGPTEATINLYPDPSMTALQMEAACVMVAGQIWLDN